ncbi:MAG: hypothetical protein Q9167_005745 [Letrouitia subvulpina]
MAGRSAEELEVLLSQALRDRDVERQARERAEQSLHKIPFLQFVHDCHEHLHTPVRVQTIQSWTTAGRIPRLKNRYYPTRLEPWNKFPEAVNPKLAAARDYFHPPGPPPLLFNPSIVTEALTSMLCRQPLASENGLRIYAKMAVEVPVSLILDQLSNIPTARLQLQVEDSVEFEHDDLTLQNTPRTPPSRTGSQSSIDSDFMEEKDRTRADQYCIRKKDMKRQLMAIVEYKPPHKLTVDSLMAGFRPMDVEKEVWSRPDIPPTVSSDDKHAGKRRMVWRDEEEKNQAKAERFSYDADCIVAAVATQTFHYMIASGLSYSYITTGMANIFLYINYQDPSTLYYHVSIPSQEEKDLAYNLTAVGQVLGLSLLAFEEGQKNQRARQEARQKLKKTLCYGFYDVLMNLPPSTEKTESSKHSEYQPPSSDDDDDSSKGKRYRKRRDKDDDGQGPHSTPSRPRGSVAGGKRKAGGSAPSKGAGTASGAYEGASGEARYCTQKCLLGLMQGTALDHDCPNVFSHTNGQSSEGHLMGPTEFQERVQDQLADDLDHDCEPLNLNGARGCLFRITLASHGYVFAAKGTTRDVAPYLRHEGRVYAHLHGLQGTAIPVYLGNIDLIHRYFLDYIPIKHMLLLSWGGNDANYDDWAKDDAAVKIRNESERTWKEVWKAGVDQRDFRAPHFLWNEEAQRVMLIDFERARFRHKSKRWGAREGSQAVGRSASIPSPASTLLKACLTSNAKRKLETQMELSSKARPPDKKVRRNVDPA